MKMKRFLLVVFSLLLLLAFIGCSDDTNNSSVTNPNPNEFYPKGYLQGKVVDSCTLKPIVGAVIDIGVAKATTDSNGQYMMSNVPATTYYDHTIGGEIDVEVDLEGGLGGIYLDEAQLDLLLTGETSGWIGLYSATIDMSNAKVDNVKVANSAVYKYASKYYNVVSVAFSSLKESDGNVSTTSNHDTPVSKLGNGNFDFLLGQLTSGISGDAVWGATYDAAAGKIALKPVSGYTVALYTVTGEENFGNSTTGSLGHRVAHTTTDATGHFSFTGLETKQAYMIAVVDSPSSAAKYAGYTLAHTLCDNDILTFNIQDGKAIHVFSTDAVCPFIQVVTIDGEAPYADLSKESIADGVDIVLYFSEPIKKTNLNTGRALLNTTDYLTGSSTTGAAAYTLYHDIDVNFEGFKASNIPHTLTWNADMTTLTIHIDAQYLQPASAYSVKILRGDNLTDEEGNVCSWAVGTQIPVSSILPGEVTYDCADEISSTNWGIWFTTYGVIPASQVKDLHVYPATPYTNARTQAATLPYELQYDQGAKLDWTAVLGAKSYNLYCRLIQWDKSCSTVCDVETCVGQYQMHPYELIANTLDTSYFTNFQGNAGWYRFKYNMDLYNYEYVESDNIKLSYQCYVRGVDADGIEGVDSNVVTIEDTVNPTFFTGGGQQFSEGQTVSSFKVCFSEPMNEYSVENATWALATNVWNTTTYAAPTLRDVDYITAGLGANATSFCATFLLSGTAQFTANATGLCAANATACNVPVLSLTAGNIVDVAGNPLVIGTNLPITLNLVTP